MKDELLPAVALNLTEKLTEKLIEKEVARQRTFAILAYFDAGQTTSSEKLLLCAVAIDPPGTLRAQTSCARIPSSVPARSTRTYPVNQFGN